MLQLSFFECLIHAVTGFGVLFLHDERGFSERHAAPHSRWPARSRWGGTGSLTAAAELAGHGRSGAAIGFQQAVLSSLAVAAPIAFAASVSASTWAAGFVLAALVGRQALRPLRAY